MHFSPFPSDAQRAARGRGLGVRSITSPYRAASFAMLRSIFVTVLQVAHWKAKKHSVGGLTQDSQAAKRSSGFRNFRAAFLPRFVQKF